MKKFIVNSETLLNAVLTVSKVISKKVAVPILEYYLFQISGQQITVSASNLQTVIKATFRCENHSNDSFDLLVPPTILKYLQKLDLSPLVFTYNEENYSIEVLDDNSRAKYSGDDVNNFIKYPVVSDYLFNISSSLFTDFKDILNYVSKDELRPAMTGICFVSKGGKFNLVATDGHKMQVLNIPYLDAITEDKHHFILNSQCAKILTDMKIKNIQEVQVKTGSENISFSFYNGPLTIEVITRDINEKFPDYSNVVPFEAPKTKYKLDTCYFFKALDKAELFANPITHQVRLSIGEKNTLSAENLDESNEFSANIAGAYEGQPIEIGFNSVYFRQTLNSFQNPVLELSAPNKCMVIREGTKLALCMPVMLSQYA